MPVDPSAYRRITSTVLERLPRSDSGAVPAMAAAPEPEPVPGPSPAV
jgi:hypothetical protein